MISGGTRKAAALVFQTAVDHFTIDLRTADEATHGVVVLRDMLQFRGLWSRGRLM